MMDIKDIFFQWSIGFFIKKNSGNDIENENASNRSLVEELHKTIIKKFNNTYLL